MDNGNKHEVHGSGFAHLAAKASTYVGSSWAFGIALLSIVVWGLSGPYFRYSDTWQLIINTATTVITFLIVFLIQNTQNRDARALHLKLDEVIRAIHGAHNDMINIERLSDRELEHLAKRYERFATEWTERRQARASENSEQN
jgi:low affinity Fe/Cu permease